MWLYLGMWRKKSFPHDDYFYFILLYLKCGCLCCVSETYSCCFDYILLLTLSLPLSLSHSLCHSHTLSRMNLFGMRAMRYLQEVSTQLEDLIQFSSSSSIICHLFNIQMREKCECSTECHSFTHINRPTSQQANKHMDFWWATVHQFFTFRQIADIQFHENTQPKRISSNH